MFDFDAITAWSRGKAVGRAQAPVSGFGTDTRALKAGEAFVALTTPKRDGHDFLAAAAANGAACAIVSREVPRAPLPQIVTDDALEGFRRIAARHRAEFSGPVFGVTGSVGKTSTKDLLTSILGPDTTCATHANLNNLIGVPLTLTRIDFARHRAAVVEAGMSEPDELGRSADIIRPDFALVTNVRPAHLEGLGSLDAIAREKSALCRAVTGKGVAIFPADCLRHAWFSELAVNCVPVVFDGEATPGFLRFARATITRAGSGHALTLDGEGFEKTDFTVGAVSDGMARNAALAAVAALLAGVSHGRIATALAEWTPSPGRGEVREHEGRLFYVDCYNASPASMADAAACFTRRSPQNAPRLFVLGGMNELGAESLPLHRSVGAGLPLRAGDTLALFGGDSAAIGEGAVSAGFSRAATRSVSSVEELAALIRDFSGSVMLKGSRGYALERALPPGFFPESAH